MRWSLLIATAANCVGSWVKCASVEMQGPPGDDSRASRCAFGILVLGQCIAAIANSFVLNLPAQLSATWFAESEVALATSIGVFGNQVCILSCEL